MPAIMPASTDPLKQAGLAGSPTDMLADKPGGTNAGANDPSAAHEGARAFIGLSPIKTHARTWLGLAALLAWVDLLLCFEGVLRDDVELAGGLVHDPVFFAMTLTASAIFLILLVISRLLPPQRAMQRPHSLWSRLNSPGGTLVVGSLMALGSLAVTLLTAYYPTVPRAVSACLGGLLGLGLAYGVLGWGAHLARLDLREALLLVTVATCAQWLPFVVLGVLPAPIRCALMAVLPLVSVWLVSRASDGDAEVRGNGAPVPTRRQDAGEDARLLLRLAVTMFVFSLVTQFIWCFFVKMLPGRLDLGLFPPLFAIIALGTGLVGLVCIAAMNRQHSYRLELFYRATVVFCTVGAAVIGACGLSSSSAEVFSTYLLVYVGYSLLCPTMWLLALGYAHLRHESPIATFSAVFCGQYLGFFAGFSLVEALATGPLATSGTQIAPLVTAAAVALLTLAHATVFPERSLLSLSPLLLGLSHESVANRCQQIARERGLTPRETEILTLLARGRDVGFISAELYISRNTVNVHRKNVYAKLGIHSQQELLSVVEGTSGYGQ